MKYTATCDFCLKRWLWFALNVNFSKTSLNSLLLQVHVEHWLLYTNTNRTLSYCSGQSVWVWEIQFDGQIKHKQTRDIMFRKLHTELKLKRMFIIFTEDTINIVVNVKPGSCHDRISSCTVICSPKTYHANIRFELFWPFMFFMRWAISFGHSLMTLK